MSVPSIYVLLCTQFEDVELSLSEFGDLAINVFRRFSEPPGGVQTRTLKARILMGLGNAVGSQKNLGSGFKGNGGFQHMSNLPGPPAQGSP